MSTISHYKKIMIIHTTKNLIRVKVHISTKILKEINKSYYHKSNTNNLEILGYTMHAMALQNRLIVFQQNAINTSYIKLLLAI